MEKRDIKDIWKSAPENQFSTNRYSLNEIQAYRKKKSVQTSRSARLTIRFDIGLKSILITGLCYLLLTHQQYPYPFVFGVLIALITALIFIENSFIQKLSQIKETDSVIENLTHKLHYLRTTHAWFVFLGALSSPLFVLCGFFLYYHFKYGEIRIGLPIEDPMTYLFLALAFVISYFSQLPVFKSQVRELKESIEDIDDSAMAHVKIEESRKRRRNYMILFSILILVGALVLLLILIRK